MPAETTNLFLLEDLEDSSRTKQLAAGDLRALRTVADWIRSFVIKPHKDLGRSGPVCPYGPGAIERMTLWLAPEQITGRSVPGVVELLNGYKQLLLGAEPVEGDGTRYKAIVVVFTDLSTDRAKDYVDDAQIQQLKQPFYADDGVVMGEFHERNEGSSVRNPDFHPFKSPVPFVLMRHAIVEDWVFFLDNEEWLNSWARRFGESAVETLAEELRRANWRRLEAVGSASSR